MWLDEAFPLRFSTGCCLCCLLQYICFQWGWVAFMQTQLNPRASQVPRTTKCEQFWLNKTDLVVCYRFLVALGIDEMNSWCSMSLRRGSSIVLKFFCHPKNAFFELYSHLYIYSSSLKYPVRPVTDCPRFVICFVSVVIRPSSPRLGRGYTLSAQQEGTRSGGYSWRPRLSRRLRNWEIRSENFYNIYISELFNNGIYIFFTLQYS